MTKLSSSNSDEMNELMKYKLDFLGNQKVNLPCYTRAFLMEKEHNN